MSTSLRAGLQPIRDTDPTDRVAYPAGDNFPERLKALADMIELGLPLKCVALDANGGYDTHDSQPGELAESLQLTADSLLAFQRDLEARGLADRVEVPADPAGFYARLGFVPTGELDLVVRGEHVQRAARLPA